MSRFSSWLARNWEAFLDSLFGGGDKPKPPDDSDDPPVTPPVPPPGGGSGAGTLDSPFVNVPESRLDGNSVGSAECADSGAAWGLVDRQCNRQMAAGHSITCHEGDNAYRSWVRGAGSRGAAGNVVFFGPTSWVNPRL